MLQRGKISTKSCWLLSTRSQTTLCRRRENHLSLTLCTDVSYDLKVNPKHNSALPNTAINSKTEWSSQPKKFTLSNQRLLGNAVDFPASHSGSEKPAFVTAKRSIGPAQTQKEAHKELAEIKERNRRNKQIINNKLVLLQYKLSTKWEGKQTNKTIK